MHVLWNTVFSWRLDAKLLEATDGLPDDFFEAPAPAGLDHEFLWVLGCLKSFGIPRYSELLFTRPSWSLFSRGADVPGSIPKLHPYWERWSTRKLAPLSHAIAKPKKTWTTDCTARGQPHQRRSLKSWRWSGPKYWLRDLTCRNAFDSTISRSEGKRWNFSGSCQSKG